MCEIFAMSSVTKRSVKEELREFFSHAPDHPNGWGLVLSSGGWINWEKEPLRADKSDYLKNRLSGDILCDMVMAHIRYATVGHVEWNNCHPFVLSDISDRQWILIHNGTIFDFSPCDRYMKKQLGETDSERVLMYLVDRISEETRKAGRDLDAWERFSVVEDVVVPMSQGNKLNILLYDGEILYVHCNMKQTLFYRMEDGMCMVSTKPLQNGYWTPVPFTRLLAYKQGKLFAEGTRRSIEYFEDEQAMKTLYLAYAEL